MAEPKRHFDQSYQETAQLSDGTPVRLRVVRPEDKQMLVRGLDRLSARSRYLRFFTNKQRLTEPELSYLTEMDGENHFALAASLERADGEHEGLGIARFVRLKGEPTVAEAAIVVLDDYQGKGLGRLLFVRLVAAARERGVERFRSEVLSENRAMRAIINNLMPGAEETFRDGVFTVDSELPDVEAEVPPDTPSARGTHYSLLALAAADDVQVKPPMRKPSGNTEPPESGGSA